MTATRVAGVVLAAGASRRLGVPKQLLPDEYGREMVVRTGLLLRDAGCEPVIAITGAAHHTVSLALQQHDITAVFNAEWDEGMASSIRRAVEWLDGGSASAATDAVVIAACDMPGVTGDHVRTMLSRFGMEHARVASSYDPLSGPRVRGVPALFPRSDWLALRALAGDRGARDLLAKPDTLLVDLPGGAFDLDTPADVERWRSAQWRSAP